MEALSQEPIAIRSRLDEVLSRVVGAGGDPRRIRVVAVTKGFGSSVVRSAIDAGIEDLGENYAQDLLIKARALEEDLAATLPAVHPRWHFLGAIQRNKVARLAPLVTTWHTVDRTSAAMALAEAQPGAEVLIEVNVTGLSSRPGCSPTQAGALVQQCREMPLDVQGLMAVGPAGDPDASRAGFRWLAEEAGRLGLGELSMGMSDDFEIAVQEGATILRLGRALFGPRTGDTVASAPNDRL